MIIIVNITMKLLKDFQQNVHYTLAGTEQFQHFIHSLNDEKYR